MFRMLSLLSPSDLDTFFLFCKGTVSLQFFFDDPAKVTPRDIGVKLLPVHLVSCVTVTPLHLRTLPQGP